MESRRNGSPRRTFLRRVSTLTSHLLSSPWVSVPLDAVVLPQVTSDLTHLLRSSFSSASATLLRRRSSSPLSNSSLLSSSSSPPPPPPSSPLARRLLHQVSIYVQALLDTGEGREEGKDPRNTLSIGAQWVSSIVDYVLGNWIANRLAGTGSPLDRMLVIGLFGSLQYLQRVPTASAKILSLFKSFFEKSQHSHWIHALTHGVDRIRRALAHAKLVIRGKKHYFNLIEILIAISIIVTFSGLVGVRYTMQLEESKVSHAEIDINTIQQALVIFYARNSRYPRELDELVRAGDLQFVPKDPWGNDYMYVPQLDWSLVLRALQRSTPDAQDRDIKYFTDCILQVGRVLPSLPDRIDPIVLLAAAFESAFVFSLGRKEPILGSQILNVNRDRVKHVAQLIRATREKAAGNLTLLQALDPLLQSVTQRSINS